jgi:O-antigen/teichoic acid export membrane protein
MHYITVQQSTNALFTFAWAGVALLTHANLETMVIGLIVGQVAETWMGWRLLRANFIKGIPLEIRWLDLKPMVLAAAPIGATMVLQALNLRLDVLILSRYVSNRELGNFQAAASFLVVTYLGTSLGMTVLFPRLSRGLRGASEWAARSVEGILKYAILVAAFGSSLVWLGAPQLLRVTYGSDLGGAAGTLRIIAGALPLVLLNSILFYVFVALDRPGVYFSALVVGIFGGGLLGLVLSARFGAIGAAWADIAREGMVSSIYLSSLAWGNCAPRAGRCLSIILATGIVLAAAAFVFHRWVDAAFPWPAIWLLIVLIGSVIGLGLPGRKDWRPMIAEDSL